MKGIDRNANFIFTLSIGFPGAVHKESQSLNELGLDDIEDEGDLREALDEAWGEWKNNYIDGGWSQ